jgi:RNA ligase-like protein
METNMTVEFKEFEKIARLNREVVITEKIDGSNAQVHIRPAEGQPEYGFDAEITINGEPHYIRAGSRNRWLAHVGSDDLNGFGRWVLAYRSELAELGAGAHFGEWWGQGIQRKYGLQEKRWSLFNTGRWKDTRGISMSSVAPPEGAVFAPTCCHVVPVLWQGIGMEAGVNYSLHALGTMGSFAAPGFKQPEGIVVFHTHARQLFKVTLERDEEPKSKRVAA